MSNLKVSLLTVIMMNGSLKYFLGYLALRLFIRHEMPSNRACSTLGDETTHLGGEVLEEK